MPQQTVPSLENTFTKGLITESTGLNFPEHAATDTDNCTYTLIGDVTRRLGINKELNGTSLGIPRTNFAIHDYKWDNAGNDGNTQVVVRQVGSALFFYKSSASTTTSPLSTQRLASSVDMSAYVVSGVVFDSTLEATFSSGNGYLFVYHPSCEPLYCTYNGGTITASPISVDIRDFAGVYEAVSADIRPSTLSLQHAYNLGNQGWTTANPWSASSTTAWNSGAGNVNPSFIVAAGIPGLTAGQTVLITYTGSPSSSPAVINPGPYATGTVNSYIGNALSIHATNFQGIIGASGSSWSITPVGLGFVSTWFSAVANYPSNSDVWWRFKNSSGVFDPATTSNNFTPTNGNAPKGRYILNAFNQNKAGVSGQGVNNVTTTSRPTNGTWFQGRVWFTGVNGVQPATGDASTYVWTENIYFSQVVQSTNDFGKCYQLNDPSSEVLFDLLPTDGGVISIQGCGSIYRLFSIQNGVLVFAANGIWFITGSQGIGFSANDYTITKISAIQSISTTSFVDVNGWPYFWNEEGIYSVQPAQSGGFDVSPITLGTILSLYNEIPVSCKKFARGAYNPIDYVIQWVYRGTEPADVTGRYTFNKILNYSTANKAFFPYTVDSSISNINGVIYVNYPGGSTASLPGFKYPATIIAGLTYAEEYDTSYLDWVNLNYDSYFVTGYKLKGQALKKFQPQYIIMYSRTNDEETSYKIQSIWDYATSTSSGRWSSQQLITNNNTGYGVIVRRHRIRGHGYACQIKVTSVDGQPFDIIGWSSTDMVNAGI